MPGYRTAYPPEFRRQMVDLVRSGRTPEELAREFPWDFGRWIIPKPFKPPPTSPSKSRVNFARGDREGDVHPRLRPFQFEAAGAGAGSQGRNWKGPGYDLAEAAADLIAAGQPEEWVLPPKTDPPGGRKLEKELKKLEKEL